MWLTCGADRRGRRFGVAVVLLFITGALAGCTGTTPEPEAPFHLDTYASSGPGDDDRSQTVSDETTLRIIGDRAIDRLARHMGWSGTGDPGTPYVISSLDLDGTTFVLQDISRSLHITDALLVAPPTAPALILWNITGLTLTDSTVHATGAPAISVFEATWVHLERNTIESDDHGIHAIATGFLDIIDNDIRAGKAAVKAQDDDGDHWIESNRIQSDQTGIHLHSSLRPSVLYQNRIEAATGIIARDTHGPVIEKNHVTAQSGIQLLGAPDALLLDNHLITTGTALVVAQSHGLFAEKTHIESQGTGIHLENTVVALFNGITFEGQKRAVEARGGELLLIANLSSEREDGAEPFIQIHDTTLPIIMDSHLFGGTNGIRLSETRQALLLENRIVVLGTAIELVDTTDTLIAENRIELAETGTRSTADALLQVYENHYFGAQTAIDLVDATDAEIVLNAFERSAVAAVSARGGSDLLLEANRLKESGMLGFDLTDNLRATLLGNEFSGPLLSVRVMGPTEDAGLVLAENRIMGGTNAISLHRVGGFELHTNLIAADRTGLILQDATAGVVYNNYFDNGHLSNVDVRGTLDVRWSIEPVAGTNVVGGAWLGGNWWHDYAGADGNGNGIGDVPYGILPYYEDLAELLGVYHYGVEDEAPLVTADNAPPALPLGLPEKDPVDGRLATLRGLHPALDTLLRPHTG